MEPEPEPEPAPRAAAAAATAAAADQAVDYDSRYRTGWAYGKKPNTFLVETAEAWLLDTHRPQDIQHPQVLSLGEGQGRNVAYLAEHGYQCLAVDASTVGLEKARTLAAQRGVSDLVQTCVADLSDFDPSATPDGCNNGPHWNVILSIFCSLPALARVRLHRSCAESLAPGGLVIVECFAPTSAAVLADETARPFRAGPPESERVSHDRLTSEFAGLEVLFAREVTRPLNEGRFHRGVVTLTQFVARAPAAAKCGLDSPHRFFHYCKSIDTIFDEVQMYRQDRSDKEVTASVAAKYELAAEAKKTSRDSSDHSAELDALLFSATALLSVTCAAAVRGRICRYCWVPQACCFCQRLAALSCKAGATLTETGDTVPEQTASTENSKRDRAARSMPRNIHWVIVSHPSEFLRSSSTARLAAALLGSGNVRPTTSGVETGEVELFRSSDCDLLVFGSPSHEAALRKLVGSAEPPLVLFPLPAGQSETAAEALLQRVDEESSRSTEEDKVGARLTVLVPDGSWDCARALVRALVSMRRSLVAKNGAGGPLRFIRLSDDLVAQHTSSIIDTLRTGAGKGRLSTLEAMAMVPAEAAGAIDALIHSAFSSPCGDRRDGELSQVHSRNSLISRVLPLNGQHAGFQVAFAGLVLLVSFVQGQNLLYREPPEFTKVSPPPRYIREWIMQFELAAKEAQDEDTGSQTIGHEGESTTEAYPLGLSRCGVCGAVLASPLAMHQHLSGKRHTRAVARRFYVMSRRTGTEPEPPLKTASQIPSGMNITQGGEMDHLEGIDSKSTIPSTSERAQSHERDGIDARREPDSAVQEQRRQLFEEHSSEPLRRNGWAEAPDVALVMLHAAMHKS